jgi:hypothetical protein
MAFWFWTLVRCPRFAWWNRPSSTACAWVEHGRREPHVSQTARNGCVSGASRLRIVSSAPAARLWGGSTRPLEGRYGLRIHPTGASRRQPREDRPALGAVASRCCPCTSARPRAPSAHGAGAGDIGHEREALLRRSTRAGKVMMRAPSSARRRARVADPARAAPRRPRAPLRSRAARHHLL